MPSGHNCESYLEWLEESMKGESGRVLLQDKVDEDVVPEETEDSEADTDGDNDASSNKESKESKDSYFKGFIAFSLWGYIPPDGGEIFQSSLIKVMQNPKRDRSRQGGRAAMKTAKVEASDKVKELEFRGTPEGIKMRGNEIEGTQYLILKGREETHKQKLFKCKNDNLQLVQDNAMQTAPTFP